MFAFQRHAFPQLVVPKWPKPQGDDTLDTYSERLAHEWRTSGDIVVGGASFGGIVALHVAKHLDPKAVILIGSIRSPAELPHLVRCLRPFAILARFAPLRLLKLCCLPLHLSIARRLVPHLHGLARQFQGCDPVVFRWSLARILDWSSTPTANCPTFQIHGERDFVLPRRYTNPDRVIRGGGHVISLTHPSQVTEFIQFTLDQISEGAGD
ncbi:MAG: alpha/beta hydrolase [Planctomycetota bacterium]